MGEGLPIGCDTVAICGGYSRWQQSLWAVVGYFSFELCDLDWSAIGGRASCKFLVPVFVSLSGLVVMLA